METKYPEIRVDLLDKDGNAFAILGNVKIAMKKGNVAQEEIDKFIEEAKSGDYDHLIQTLMKWVTVEQEHIMQYNVYCPNCDHKMIVEEFVNNYVIKDIKGRVIDRCPNCDIRLVLINGQLKEDKI